MTDHGAEQPQLPASQSVWQSAVDGSVADGSMHAALQPLRSVTSNANRMAAAFSAEIAAEKRCEPRSGPV